MKTKKIIMIGACILGTIISMFLVIQLSATSNNVEAATFKNKGKSYNIINNNEYKNLKNIIYERRQLGNRQINYNDINLVTSINNSRNIKNSNFLGNIFNYIKYITKKWTDELFNKGNKQENGSDNVDKDDNLKNDEDYNDVESKDDESESSDNMDNTGDEELDDNEVEDSTDIESDTSSGENEESGSNNIESGSSTGESNDTGSGTTAGGSNDIGSGTTAGGSNDAGNGTSAGENNNAGSGTSAGGSNNVGNGTSAGGSSNTGSGTSAGGSNNIGSGTSAGGSDNTGSGTSAGGSDNTGSGTSAGGNSNTGSGTSAGGNSNTGSGTSAGGSSNTGSGTTSGGSSNTGNSTENKPTTNVVTKNDSFTNTMYDYTKAGVSYATGKVAPSDYISVNEYGIYANTGKDLSCNIIGAIHDATSKGKYLYFPEGTYYIKNVKIYDLNNVKICGAGNKTILKTANDASGNIWDIAMGIYNADGVVVRNLVFDGNNKNVCGNTQVGVIQLRLENCDNAKVYGCRFQNNNSGNINIVDEAKNLEIFYCDFLNSDCSVITSPGFINKGYICNNFIDGQDWKYSEPISLYYAQDKGFNKDIVISGNDIRNHDKASGGIFITYPSTNISVLNNYIYKCGAGIGSASQRETTSCTKGPTNIDVKNNIIDSPTWHGMQLIYADYWTISDNTLKNITNGFGIYLVQCDNNNIFNNNLNGSRIREENCVANTINQ